VDQKLREDRATVDHVQFHDPEGFGTASSTKSFGIFEILS
jgi:hypothetical protein